MCSPPSESPTNLAPFSNGGLLVKSPPPSRKARIEPEDIKNLLARHGSCKSPYDSEDGSQSPHNLKNIEKINKNRKKSEKRN